MKRAIEKHKRRETLVIPIILRPCDWRDAPFSIMQVLPSNGVPLTSWNNLDEGLLDITIGIKKAINRVVDTNATANSKAHEIKSYYNSLVTTRKTPYIYVNAILPNVIVPLKYVENGKVILNISLEATKNLIINDKAVSFSAMFGGVTFDVYVPINAILSLYSKEDNLGISWD